MNSIIASWTSHGPIVNVVVSRWASLPVACLEWVEQRRIIRHRWLPQWQWALRLPVRRRRHDVTAQRRFTASILLLQSHHSVGAKNNTN